MRDSIMKKVLIIATKDCHQRHILRDRLLEVGVQCTVECVDDYPELIEKYGITNAPNIIVNDKVVFRGKFDQHLPSLAELKKMCNS